MSTKDPGPPTWDRDTRPHVRHREIDPATGQFLSLHGQAPDGRGKIASPTYHSWAAMKKRCLQIKCPGYARYGARGITICPQWLNSFVTFLADMGERPKGTTLDRIDNTKGYCPGNCRWSDIATQNLNRTCIRWIEINGEVDCMKGWATRFGLGESCISARLDRGITGADLLKPSRVKNKRKARAL